jgi:hypothetical protein
MLSFATFIRDLLSEVRMRVSDNIQALSKPCGVAECVEQHRSRGGVWLASPWNVAQPSDRLHREPGELLSRP